MKAVSQKKHSIQRLLAVYLIGLLTIVLTLTSVIFSIWQYRILKQDAIAAMTDSTEAIGMAVDREIAQMSTISLNAISSQSLIQSFYSYENTTSAESGVDAFNHNRSRRQLANALASVKGFDFSIRQMNIYSIDTAAYGVGSYNGDIPVSAGELPWHDPVVAANGHLYICDPSCDAFLSDESNLPEGTRYFSVARTFFNSLHQRKGFIEIKKYYDVVFASAMGQQNAYEAAVYIYDESGRQLYPFPDSEINAAGEAVFSYYDYQEQGDGTLEMDGSRPKEYVTFFTSEDNHLLVVQALDMRKLMAPVYLSLRWLLLLYLLIFIVGLSLSSLISRRLSLPIKHIYHFLNHPHEDEFTEIQMADTGVREIDRLRDSLNEDIRSKKNATQTMMSLKEQEMQAQMLALQSQMNPHFLYNSLSTIAEMSAEGLNDQVAAMCSDITEILRYISSNREQTTSLEEEMELCSTYLDCMQLRYRKDLSHSFVIDDAMLDHQIPKLCIQMLVENSIKYCTNANPPWFIRITGSQDENNWYLTVQDNGPGFDPKVEANLRQQMEEILATGILPSLQIRGMGLLNIFIRFYLLYGKGFIFRFGTAPEGGGYVTVGAPIVPES